MNKKVFQTNRLNELQQQQRKALLIFPVLMLVLLIWGGTATLKELNTEHFLSGLLCVLFLAALCTIILGIVPFYMQYMKLQGQKKQVLENSSFITIHNLEYYRDKLVGISPGAISMLEDLRLEPDKDITACILHYEVLGVLRQTETGYEMGGKSIEECRNLSESDHYMIRHLLAGDWRQESILHTWQQKVITEIKKNGWITERLMLSTEIKKQNKRESHMMRIWIVVLLLFCLIVTLGIEKNIFRDALPKDVFDKIPNAVFVVGEMQKEVLDKLDLVNTSGKTANELLFGDFDFLWKLTFIIAIDSVFLLLLLFPVLYMTFGKGRKGECSPYKRTPLGEVYTEYIYGMKNFIHDYSNLSEAEKDSLVLWDDYLIYAVVLEENEKIIEEMMQRREAI